MAAGAVAHDVAMDWDEKFYEGLVKENEEELKTFDKEEEDAAESAGDVEVLQAKGKKAEFWAKVLDKVRLHECALQYGMLTMVRIRQ